MKDTKIKVHEREKASSFAIDFLIYDACTGWAANFKNISGENSYMKELSVCHLSAFPSAAGWVLDGA